MKVTSHFLEGIKKAESQAVIDIADLAEYNIIPCRSCYACWSISKGECILSRKKEDEMQPLFEKYVAADRVIISTPMHFFNCSSLIMRFLERTFPLISPIYTEKDYPGPKEKEKRKKISFDMSSKEVAVISTCKVIFPGAYDVIDKHFSIMTYGTHQAIYSTQPLVSSVNDKPYILKFFNAVEAAGYDFGLRGKFSEESIKELNNSIEEMKNNVITLGIAY